MKKTKTNLDKKPKIILVDDHLIFRQGLKSLIVYENLGTVVGEASDGNEFLELLPKLNPDLVIMDIDMPNMNGVNATQKALEKHPDLKIIILSISGGEEYYIQMIELGIKGYIIKSSGIIEVEHAINAVMEGKTYFTESIH